MNSRECEEPIGPYRACLGSEATRRVLAAVEGRNHAGPAAQCPPAKCH